MASNPFSTPPQDPSNPYGSPRTTSGVGGLPPIQTGLGSLGQEARLKHLNTAKWIMIVIGILTIGVNAFQFATAEKLVDAELDKELRKQGVARQQIDQAAYAEARNTVIRTVKLMCGALIGLGVLYIVMGMFVKQYPVPLTIAALVLYIGSAAVFAILDPATLASGLIVKILIIVGLAKAVQAALAYERERKALIAAEFGG